ncbi:hypothetical protein [Sulfolobus acidocaldarius]|uniref:Conserved protein n=4 Tax=Sulfolobus acidocaldarius TaxID=2285 RepID=Q4J7B4_SULAC|nr:hypothetical protein [Sulfolobus acidocaldarius]AAY81317.1 conserved protein [Sulfolobus acidocaldarius DSM 639]AGE71957.1 hypothetical protein SacN8_10035 [Sulfolobus acidocaldarius N8]AGE74229.1 hypothetical protein SacRon12I_10055 [Sulfolobus acidocaldarius Ron12/I]ALU29881.1 hypothetical protein ATY89_07975 [Sulfolobus acidocaldarius]ALU32621.1 hypothetical protein ATZ20_10995 [Sulfolobus acidocaldarius]
MTPERYANAHLIKFLLITGISQEDIHDARVELRKYLTIARTTYKLHNNPECVLRASKLMKRLGKIRDMDILACVRSDSRDKLARETVSMFQVMRKYLLPRLYGSRLLVAERIYNDYRRLKEEVEFHSIRKIVREVRFLVESLDLSSDVLKDISQEMGSMRDRYLFDTVCLGKDGGFNEERVKELKERALEEIVEKLRLTNFKHLKV